MRPDPNPSKTPNITTDVDVTLLEFNLSLSYEERLNNHQRAFEILQEIIKARKTLYGELK